MKTVSGMVVSMFLLGLLALSGATATEDIVEPVTFNTSGDPVDPEEVEHELYSKLPPGTSETIAALGGTTCEFGLRILNDQGWYLPKERDDFGFEYDPLDGSCKDFRDTLEHRVLNGEDPPYLMHCEYIAGITCVAVGHYACDFALIIGSGMVYYCLGGLTPYN